MSYKYLLVLAYNGYHYAGFQSQINALSIQDVFLKALKTVLGEELSIIFASRTDAGVSAKYQVVHFRSDKQPKAYHFLKALNHQLPSDIRAKSLDVVSDDFHAQKNILYKHYSYTIETDLNNPFDYERAYYCPFNLNFQKLKEITQVFVGLHDFTSFNTTPLSVVANQEKLIYAIHVKRFGSKIIIDVYGKSFLRHMVRILVGAMVDYARGKLSKETIMLMLEKPSKDYHRFNAPACGLCLEFIKYLKK